VKQIGLDISEALMGDLDDRK